MPPSKQEMEQLRSQSRVEAADAAMTERGGFQHCVKLPTGVQYMKLEARMYRLDILAQQAGKRNPTCDERKWARFCTYWRHPKMGADNKQMYPCPAHYRDQQRCPFCEFVSNNPTRLDPDTLTGIKAKERMLWAVIDLDDKGKGIQVLDNAPFKGLGGSLQDLKPFLKGDQKYYDDPLGGYTVHVNVTDEKSKFGPMKAFGRAELVKRDKQYDESIFDKIPVLDDCLLQPSYAELKKILEISVGAGRPEEPEEDESPRGRSTSRGVDVEDDDVERRYPSRPVNDSHLNGHAEDSPKKSREADPDDGENTINRGDVVRHKKYGICDVVKITNGLLRLEDAAGDMHLNVQPSEVSKVSKKASFDDDAGPDPDDDDDEGEEEETPRKRTRRK